MSEIDENLNDIEYIIEEKYKIEQFIDQSIFKFRKIINICNNDDNKNLLNCASPMYTLLIDTKKQLLDINKI